MEAELKRLDADVSEGVQKISRALVDPNLESNDLALGVRGIARATRALGRFESDPRASEIEQLMAIIYQARAWDAVAAAYASATLGANVAPENRGLLASVLAEKSLQARAAAASSWRRAKDRTSRVVAIEPAMAAEINEGLARSGDGP